MPAEFDDLELNYTPWLPESRDAAILDVGCGPGRVLAFLESLGYRRLEGFDRDPEAVAAARRRVRAPIAVEDDWSRLLTGRPRAYDVVILKDVIYYVPRERVVDALRLVHGALKPGGRVIVEVFNGAAFTGQWTANKDAAILWTPTEHTLRSFLEKAGFSSVALRAQRPPSRTLRRRVFNAFAALWRLRLRLMFILERGFAEENPRFLTTKIIGVGEVTA